MPRIRYVLIASLGMMSFGMNGPQDSKKADKNTEADEPDLVITPHTIRVQPPGYVLLRPTAADRLSGRAKTSSGASDS
jgi:hypothetical protein